MYLQNIFLNDVIKVVYFDKRTKKYFTSSKTKNYELIFIARASAEKQF